MPAYASKDVNKENTHPVLVGSQNCIACMQISMVVPPEYGNSSCSRSKYTTLGHMHFILSQCTSSYHRDTCLTIDIGALFTIAKKWKQPRCPSTEEQIQKIGTFTQWNITQLLKTMKS